MPEFHYYFRDEEGTLIADGSIESDDALKALKQAYLTDETIIESISDRMHVDYSIQKDMIVYGLSKERPELCKLRKEFLLTLSNFNREWLPQLKFDTLIDNFLTFLLVTDPKFKEIDDPDEICNFLEEEHDCSYEEALLFYCDRKVLYDDFEDLNELTIALQRWKDHKELADRRLDIRNIKEETLEYLIGIDIKNGMVSIVDASLRGVLDQVTKI